MHLRISATLVCLALGAVAWAAPPERTGPPRVTLGPYVVGVERLARVREFERPAGMQARTAFTIFVEAKTSEELDKVVDVCRDPAASDDVQRAPLTFTTIGPCVQTRKLRRYAEVLFSGTALGATRIRALQGTLVYYEGKRHFALETSAVPGETAEMGGLRLTVASVGPGKDDAGRTRLVARLELAFAPGERPAVVEEWQAESLAMLDSGGDLVEPLSYTHQYRYDAQRRLSGVSMAAYFELLPEGRQPASLRYGVDRLIGLKSLPYRFENLPLP